MNGFEPKEVNTLIETSSQLGYNSDAGIIKTMRNGLLQFSDPKLYTRAVTEPMPQYENAENVDETLKQMNEDEESEKKPDDPKTQTIVRLYGEGQDLDDAQ